MAKSAIQQRKKRARKASKEAFKQRFKPRSKKGKAQKKPPFFIP
jgi:hypothetical protein